LLNLLVTKKNLNIFVKESSRRTNSRLKISLPTYLHSRRLIGEKLTKLICEPTNTILESLFPWLPMSVYPFALFIRCGIVHRFDNQRPVVNYRNCCWTTLPIEFASRALHYVAQGRRRDLPRKCISCNSSNFNLFTSLNRCV